MIPALFSTTNRYLAAWLLLCGMSFEAHTDGKYRVFIGEDRSLDWVDVCCKYNENIELEYADYTPIEVMEITRQHGAIQYQITKKYSKWKLTGVVGDVNSWVLQWLP